MLARTGGAGDLNGRSIDAERAVSLALLLLAAALTGAVALQFDLWAHNGLWNDEYYTIWATDPAAPLASLVGGRILPDSNPPLYFIALAGLRRLIAEPRVAFIVIDALLAALAFGYVWRLGVRGRMPAAAIAAMAVFALNGAVACYFPEGRPYFAAMCAAFAIAFAAASATEGRGAAASLAEFALLGALASMTHVFGALFAGCIGAALLLEGVLSKRRTLIQAGFALAGGASALFALWIAFAGRSAGNVSWIEFTPASVREAVWYVRELALGPNLAAIVMAAFLAWSALRPQLRPQFRVFAAAGALFVALPLAASFVVPLIVGRYWLVGAPALFVLAIMAVRAHIAEASTASGRGRQRAQAAAVAGVACIAMTSLFGAFAAERFTASKPTWLGAAEAAPIVAACPAGSVHIIGVVNRYATASGAPANRFVNAADPATPTLDAKSARCPLIGWAEHIFREDLATAPDRELLDMLKISGEVDADVRIARRRTGFSVFAASPHETP
jgi:hypothetical protein